MKAKKSFGQHFLVNESIAESIANSLEMASEIKNILEIGPGKGVLTKYLVKQDTNLKVVEADQDMVHFLTTNKILAENQIIFLDFLKLNMHKVFDGQPFLMIGNYPYNISSQILFKMVNTKELVPEMVGMFQLEMADRVVAKPGSKDYGVISVLAQAYYDGKKLFDVDRTCFSPPPNVQSAVIRLTRKDNQDLGCDEILFKNVVKTSFNQRRKMLRNTVRPFFEKAPSVLTDTFFNRRPETLSLEEFVNLTKQIAEL